MKARWWLLTGCACGVAAVSVAVGDTSLLSEFTPRRWSVEDGMPESTVISIEQRGDGYLWCATPRHLLRFDGIRFVEMGGEPPAPPVRDGVSEIPPGVGKGEVTAWAVGPGGVSWVGTNRGLYRMQEGRWSALTARDGVFPCDVRCLALDREGNPWMGTSGGLVRLRRRSVIMCRAQLASTTQPITALMVESPTNFWVGVAGGGLMAGAPEDLARVRVGQMPEDATVSALCRGRDGTLWIGTQGDRLWRLSPDGTVSVIGEAAKAGVVVRGVNALLEDRRGRLWVGTWDGLMRLNKRGDLAPVKVQAMGAGKARSLADAVQILCEDPEGRLWAGFQRSGLIRIDADEEAVRIQEDVGVLSGSLFALLWDSAGTLWIGTSAGVGQWRGDEFRQFTTDNGLADNVVLQILEDGTGHLWLGTRQGVMRVRKSEFEDVAAGRKTVMAARHFGSEAGMANEECTGRFGARAERTADGRMWFPTMDGIASIDPKRISPQRMAPVASVEEVLLDGESVPLDSEVRLPVGRRDIEFRFTAPALTAPERMHFKYRLDGHDSGWSRATADRAASYSVQGPGAYRFHVMARDRDSEWGEPSEPVGVIVPAFFWETASFWICVGVVALAGAGMGVRKYYRGQAARQLDALERRLALERERERIARDIHDDVGAGLTEVAMLSELAQGERDEPVRVHGHLDAIFRRATDLARSLDEIVWAINPSNDTLESFLSYIGESAQGFLSAAGVACRLDFPAETPSIVVGATVRHHLCLAVKEAIHNIVKHAGADEVHVEVAIKGRELSVAIRDNGEGFEPAADFGAGCDGLANLRTRMDEIGGRFHQESGSGRGTVMLLSVKLPTEPAAGDVAV